MGCYFNTSIMGDFTFNCLLVLACVCACQTAQIQGYHNWRSFGIIHGKPIKIEDAPYMAQLRIKGSKERHCGASIVGEQFLLTAGHCYRKGTEFFAIVGTDKVMEGQKVEIEKMVRHPHFGEGGRANNDVTVVKLKQKLNFNEKMQPIKMADPDIVIKDGFNVTSLGFGMTENGHGSDTLLKVDMPVVNSENCSKHFTDATITDQMICAGGEMGDCFGDSGGPLVYKNTLIGIVSWGAFSCKAPTVFARVSALRDFIDEVINNNS